MAENYVGTYEQYKARLLQMKPNVYLHGKKIAKYLAGIPGYEECPRYERAVQTPRAMLAKFDAAKAAKK